MTVWTRQQQALVAVLPKIAAALTMFGSGWILTEITTHKASHVHSTTATRNSVTEAGRLNQPKIKHPYHRLLLGMCIYDFMEAIWNFQSTWPIPQNPNRIWSTGTQGTCSAQGFFLMLSIAVPIYSASLAIYYMLVIVFNFTEKMLVSRVEPLMHLTAGSFAFGTSLTMLIMGYYNDANLWCWIAPYPTGCLDSWTHGYPPENTNPCTRGDLYWIFRWAFFFAPLWLCFLVASVCTMAVYCKVSTSERRTLKYRRPEASVSGFSQSIIERRSTAGPEDSSSVFLKGSSTADNAAQVRQVLKDIAQEEEAEDAILMGQRAEVQSSSAQSPAVDEGDKVTDTASFERINPSPSDATTGRRSEFQRKSSTLGRSMQLIGKWKDSQSEHIKYNPRTAQVAQQSFWYLLALFMCYIWSTTNRIYQQIHGQPIFGITVVHCFFDPLHGFLNFLVYQRPRYLTIRKKHPEIGRLGAMRSVLRFSFQQSQLAAKVRERINALNKQSNADIPFSSNSVVSNDGRGIVSASIEANGNSVPPQSGEDKDDTEKTRLEYVERELSLRCTEMRSLKPSTIDEQSIGESKEWSGNDFTNEDKSMSTSSRSET